MHGCIHTCLRQISKFKVLSNLYHHPEVPEHTNTVQAFDALIVIESQKKLIFTLFTNVLILTENKIPQVYV